MAYQVVLVDDENIFLEYLMKAIDWAKEDCEICAVAKNGEEAIRILADQQPDIVFLDIEMSKLNGLRVCEHIRLWENRPRVIIMTGHNEFSFAQQAIKLNVFDYLLKPFDATELLNALHTCIVDIEREQRMKQIEREHFLRMVLDTGIAENDRIAEDLGKDQRYLAAMLKLPKGRAFEQQGFMRLLQCSFMPLQVQCYFISNENSCVLMVQKLLNPVIDLNAIKACYLKLIRQAVLEFVALSNPSDGLWGLKKCKHEARAAFENSVRFHDRVIVFDELTAFNADYRAYSIKDLNHMIKCFKDKDYKQVDLIIERIFGLSKGQMLSFQYAITVYHSLAINVFTHFNLSKNDSRLNDYLEMQNNIIQDLTDCTHEEQLITTIKNYVYELFCECMDLEKSNKKNALVKRVDKYLQNNFANHHLTVDDVAEHLFFENSYIRRVYKTITGKTIIQRLEEIRIDKAKQLLASSEYKHADIAELTGFADQSYFSKRFKLFCGYTPSEYQAMSNGKR